MYDAENVEIKFSRLRRHLKGPTLLFQSQRIPLMQRNKKSKEKTGQCLIEMVLRELDFSLLVENKT